MLLILTLACSPTPEAGPEEPLSAALLVQEENPRRKLWLYEDAGAGFVRREPHIARDISSLGAIVADNELILTGICWWPGCGSPEEMKKRQERGPAVFGLSTRDLESWTPRQWRLNDSRGFTPIDPQLSSGPEGLELWYFGAPGQAHVDPMDRKKHAIRRAPLQEDGRFHARESIVEDLGLADPSPIRFRDQDWLFVTQFAAESVVAYKGSPPQKTHRFQGVSVPHALVVDDALWLLASQIVNGRQQPVRAISTDGETFSDFEPFLPLKPDQVCASPVGAVFSGKIAVFCVEEPTRPG